VTSVALGRLLTAVGLAALTAKRPGSVSFQVMSRGRIRQVYADGTDQGHVRGMVRAPAALGLPRSPGQGAGARVSLGHLLSPGQLSVIRLDASGRHAQSAVPLATGELDEDVEAFLERSDQVPTALRAEVLLDGEGGVVAAGGALAQLLPDGDPAALEALRARLAGDGLSRLVAAHADDPRALLHAVEPGAELVEAPAPLAWRCRCSRERAAASLRLFPAADLAEMIEAGTPFTVDCDLCGERYPFGVDELSRAFAELAKAEG
jgi:molecular chaperone Hsp33